DLLPPGVQMIHGPGCPVCVLPMARIDAAIQLAQIPNVTLCSYGDMLRVPGVQRMSLLKAKANGADVRMVTSPQDALSLACDNPMREIVFFAIGFETTAPPTSVIVKQSQALGLKNFSVFCNHVLTPPALGWILESGENETDGVPPLDGFVGPAHVSTVIGMRPYEIAAKQYDKPVVIAGFEPLDVLQAILMLIRQAKAGRAEVENEYTRAVTPEGNVKAQELMQEVFELRDTFEWRGLGFIPKSAFRLRSAFSAFDAERRFPLPPSEARENPACQCPAILRGAKVPTDCKLFGTACTPENPIGSCMVSSEGGCAAMYSYGRQRNKL
ncbi:MAG: hydrogenase formation protein HypD, partial [Alphaproteobacteria bacterium]|nr:hydrogenase formation protein HypD [Alphaproteobacteria bacterium]